MIAVKSLVAGTLLSATLWSASEANAGCGCRRSYRTPVYYPPIVHVHHHGPHGPGGPGGPGGPHMDDDDHGGGPGGGQGLGGPGGRGGIGQGGPQGLGGPNGGGPNGGGRNGGMQNGQGQNGNGQNGNNQNGQGQVTPNNQNQNGNTAQAVQVPSGAQVTLTGSYGNDGQVYLNINNVKLPLAIDQWTETGITLTLPSVQLTQAQSATIDVVAKNGKTDSIAITLNPQAKLVVNNQPKPANPGGGGTVTVSTTHVSGAQ